MTRLLAAALIVTLGLLTGWSTSGTDAAAPGGGWVMPLLDATVVRGFEAPAHAYAPGHRGVDLSAAGTTVRTPADGTIAFAGPVAGRAIVTIDHGQGWVTSLEPVETALQPGTAVSRGEHVGTVSSGGHTGDSSIHFGVRRDGEYVNPLIMVTGLTRPVLLPCC